MFSAEPLGLPRYALHIHETFKVNELVDMHVLPWLLLLIGLLYVLARFTSDKNTEIWYATKAVVIDQFSGSLCCEVKVCEFVALRLNCSYKLS